MDCSGVTYDEKTAFILLLFTFRRNGDISKARLDYGVILVKFVPCRSLSLEFPLVFTKDEEEKQERCLFY